MHARKPSVINRTDSTFFPAPTSLHPSAAHRRRHSSLPPPPQPQFRSASPAHSVTRETTPEPTSTLRSHSLSPFNTTRPTTSLLTPGGLPLPPPDLFSTTSGLTTPRRRVQGPRLMGKTSATSPIGTGPAPFVRDSPQPLNVESERTLQRASSRPTSISSQTKRQRSLVEASPRATPAKKVLGISEGLSRGSMNQTRPRIPSGSLASRNVSARKPRRLTSGASTIRGDSPPLPAAPSRETSRPESIMTIPDVSYTDLRLLTQLIFYQLLVQDPEYSNLERLKMHIINLRTKLGRELQMKENERTTAAGLSRSPNFRNVSLLTLLARGNKTDLYLHLQASIKHRVDPSTSFVGCPQQVIFRRIIHHSLGRSTQRACFLNRGRDLDIRLQHCSFSFNLVACRPVAS